MNKRRTISGNDNIQEELNIQTFAEKEENMKIKKTFTGWAGKGLLTLILSCGMLLAVVPAWSAVDCTVLTSGTDASFGDLGDFDNDGLLNGEECTSITLWDGMSVPSCPATSAAGCLDPNKKDLFIILNPAPGSMLIPEDPFALVAETATGLGIVEHVISYSQANPANRTILIRDGVPAVRAAQITESLTPATENDTKIGTAQQGMLIDKATVYTQRIVDKVNAVCAEQTTCMDISGIGASDRQALIDLYIRHTLAHELGHILGVAPKFNRRFDGHHWKAGSGFVMDQSVVYTSRKGKVTFYITKPYKAESQNSLSVQ